MTVSFWTTTNPAPRRAESTAAAVEAAGWDGLTFTDSQNLSGNVYVALGFTARATSRDRARARRDQSGDAAPRRHRLRDRHRADPVRGSRRARDLAGRFRALPPGARARAGGGLRARPGASPRVSPRRRGRPGRIREPHSLAGRVAAAKGAGGRGRHRPAGDRGGRATRGPHHTENAASHSRALEPAFLDRFAVVGPPSACVARLAEVVAAGIERLVVIGPSRDAEPRQAERSNALFLNEALPALRGRPTRSP